MSTRGTRGAPASGTSRAVRAKAGQRPGAPEIPRQRQICHRPHQQPTRCRNQPTRGISLSKSHLSGGFSSGKDSLTSPVGGRPRCRRPVAAASSPSELNDLILVEGEQMALCVGIETEFILEPRMRRNPSDSTKVFLNDLTEVHNEEVDSRYSMMEAPDTREQPGDALPDYGFRRWVVVEEPSLFVWADNPGKFAVEMKTPKFQLCHSPKWRNQVHTTWAILEKQCRIWKSVACSTHVHVSVSRDKSSNVGMELPMLKKVAQCAIHFEPALEALAPPERRGNPYAMSNWIDNKRFAEALYTRREVIQRIGGCESVSELIKVMCPNPPYRYLAWNFHSIKRLGTIEYRKGGASLTAEESIVWADLVLLFVHAALQLDSINSLIDVPANIGALKAFLGSASSASGVPVDLDRIKLLTQGKRDAASLQPKRQLICEPEMAVVLDHKLRIDDSRQRRLAEGWKGWSEK